MHREAVLHLHPRRRVLSPGDGVIHSLAQPPAAAGYQPVSGDPHTRFLPIGILPAGSGLVARGRHWRDAAGHARIRAGPSWAPWLTPPRAVITPVRPGQCDPPGHQAGLLTVEKKGKKNISPAASRNRRSA